MSSNIKIMHKNTIYRDLPDDDLCRVVWWYGGIIKNSSSRSSEPLIEVMFIGLSLENELLGESDSQIITLPISALDRFKIGSMWKNKEYIGEFWELELYKDEIKQDKLIKLSFSDSTRSFLIDSDDKYEFKDNKIPYIPKKNTSAYI